jgi:hypothetical protein
VTVWTAAEQTSSNLANPASLATPVTLNFGNAVCAL